jgi:hypothetical protein
MRIRRAVVPVILALGVAGSILTGSTVSVTIAQAPSVHVLAASPNILYEG